MIMKRFTLVALLFFTFISVDAQEPEYYNLSFLTLNTNTRLAGFGDVGIVSSRFYKNSGVYQNPALISNNSRSLGADISRSNRMY